LRCRLGHSEVWQPVAGVIAAATDLAASHRWRAGHKGDVVLREVGIAIVASLGRQEGLFE
jgi:hypothetical protein